MSEQVFLFELQALLFQFVVLSQVNRFEMVEEMFDPPENMQYKNLQLSIMTYHEFDVI